MSIVVVRPGLLSTIQDRGRYGWQHVGVVPCGAMDDEALQLANALVGNPIDQAALEITIRGPELLFDAVTLIAVCGATLGARVASADRRDVPLPLNRPVLLERGTRLALGDASHGARAYLAVAGGIDVAPVMGSRSTYVPGGFGGIDGRALRADDRIPLTPQAEAIGRERFERVGGRGARVVHDRLFKSVRWCVPVRTLPDADPITVRFVDGRHAALFATTARTAFERETYRISADSNRMGYRLIGPRLARKKDIDVLSEPTCLGTVQVPADGVPIVLMADHQTTGGYAKIAEIASADVPRLAQLKPGASVRFERCSLAEAITLREAVRARHEGVERAIAWEYRA